MKDGKFIHRKVTLLGWEWEGEVLFQFRGTPEGTGLKTLGCFKSVKEV